MTPLNASTQMSSCVGNSFNYKARCMNRTAHAALTVLSLHTFTCCCAVAQACSCITASFSKSHPQPPQLPVMQNGGQEKFILIFTYWLRTQKLQSCKHICNNGYRKPLLLVVNFCKKKKKVLRMVFTVLNYLVNSQQSSISLTVRSPEV